MKVAVTGSDTAGSGPHLRPADPTTSDAAPPGRRVDGGSAPADGTGPTGGWVPDDTFWAEVAARARDDRAAGESRRSGRSRAPSSSTRPDNRKPPGGDAGTDPADSVGATQGSDDEYADDGYSDDEDSDDEDSDEDEVSAGADRPIAHGGDPRRSRRRATRLSRGPWGRFAELWVPEPMVGARVDPGRRGAVTLLIIATLAAIVTAAGVWRDQPEPRPVESVSLVPQAADLRSVDASDGAAPPGTGPTGTPPTGVDPTGAGAPSATAGAAPTGAGAPPTGPQPGANSPSGGAGAPIVVSVTGLVARPGLVSVPSGARVMDAIDAAGGTTAEADLTGLNLATRLADGDSVVVGTASAAAGGPSASSVQSQTGAALPPGGTGSGPVDLNTADAAALDALPGIGPVTAQNILAWRAEHGRFATVEQLQEIGGIGPARFAQLSGLVRVS